MLSANASLRKVQQADLGGVASQWQTKTLNMQ
jgi:hypothetical protein